MRLFIRFKVRVVVTFLLIWSLRIVYVCVYVAVYGVAFSWEREMLVDDGTVDFIGMLYQSNVD